MTDRPKIPAPIKRAVRQRCGFGCVLCGLPIYDYEHMAEWVVTQQHVSDEMTLLCPTHHAEKTRGLLPDERVRAANAAPFNLQTGETTAWKLHYAGSRCEAIIGGNQFSAATIDGDQVLVPLMIDGETLILFRVEGGHLLLSLSVCDERNEPVLLIEDNESLLMVGAALAAGRRHGNGTVIRCDMARQGARSRWWPAIPALSKDFRRRFVRRLRGLV